jgi:hypothetical protein
MDDGEELLEEEGAEGLIELQIDPSHPPICSVPFCSVQFRANSDVSRAFMFLFRCLLCVCVCVLS